MGMILKFGDEIGGNMQIQGRGGEAIYASHLAPLTSQAVDIDKRKMLETTMIERGSGNIVSKIVGITLVVLVLSCKMVVCEYTHCWDKWGDETQSVGACT